MTAGDQPIAVVFDLVNPPDADRRLGRKRRDAGIDKALRAATSRRTTPEHSGYLGCDVRKQRADGAAGANTSMGRKGSGRWSSR